LLEREIDFIKKYIKLYSINLDNDFIDLKVTRSINNIMIPPMLLIPLIENAMKHSNKNIKNQGINIEISINESKLTLKTKNHIKPILKNKTSKKGVGLENLHKRLELTYGENQKLFITEEESIFSVELSIPI
jgi:LytS/YehU family sensor histidine kinase